jgi:hypothetical protein
MYAGLELIYEANPFKNRYLDNQEQEMSLSVALGQLVQVSIYLS